MLTINIEVLKRVRILVDVHTEWFDAVIQWHIQPQLPKKRVIGMLLREFGDAGQAMLTLNGQNCSGRTENEDGCVVSRWHIPGSQLKSGVNEFVAWVDKEQRRPYLANVEVNLASDEPEGVVPEPRSTSQWSLAVQLGEGFDPRHDTWRTEVERGAAKVNVWLAREAPEGFHIDIAAAQGLDWLVLFFDMLKRVWDAVCEKREELLKLLEKLAEHHERMRQIERDLDAIEKYQRLHRRLEKAMRARGSVTLMDVFPELANPALPPEVIPAAEPVSEVHPRPEPRQVSSPPPLPNPAPMAPPAFEPSYPSRRSSPNTDGVPSLRRPRLSPPGNTGAWIIRLFVLFVVVGLAIWGVIAWRQGQLDFIFGAADNRANVKGDKVDVVFVIDATASMKPHYVRMTENIGRLTEKLREKNRDVRFGVAIFRDRMEFPFDEPFTLKFGEGEFTRDLAELSNQIRGTPADNGGDLPESGLDGLVFASKLSYRADAARVMVLITDNDPRIPDKETKSEADAAAALRRNGIHQLHLIIPDWVRRYDTVQQGLGANAGGRGNIDGSFDRVFDEIAEGIIARFPKGG